MVGGLKKYKEKQKWHQNSPAFMLNLNRILSVKCKNRQIVLESAYWNLHVIKLYISHDLNVFLKVYQTFTKIKKLENCNF